MLATEHARMPLEGDVSQPILKTRNRTAEKKAAKSRNAQRIGEMVVARHEGTLGLEYIKLAQAMILCTLPYSEQSDRKIKRRARLGDGSYLTVTFHALQDGVPLPYGADRKLLAWIFDRAIRSNSPFIPWDSANEYQREMGLSMGGRTNRQLNQRFQRIAGLVIDIRRQAEATQQSTTYPIIERSYLPSSITGRTIDAGQGTLPEMGDRFGFMLNSGLFHDIRKYHVVLPRQIWRDLTGPTQVQDIVYWLLVRCFAAASESVIPWTSLEEQFGIDSNPRRLKQHTREAIRVLQTLWPSVRLREEPQGICVDHAPEPLLPNDAPKGRTRKLTA